MYISKITIRNFRIFDEIGITAFLKRALMLLLAKIIVVKQR